MGEEGWGLLVERRGEGAVLKGGGGPPSLLLLLRSVTRPAVDSQLLQPQQQTEATQGPKLGRTLAAALPPVLSSLHRAHF